MALPVSDTFLQSTGSAQNLTTYSASWSILEGSFSVPSGISMVDGTSGAYNTARHNVETFNADQRARCQLTSAQIGAGIYAGPAVRCQSGANTSYHCESNGSALYFSKCVAGSQTTLAGPVSVSLAGGDWLAITVEGVGATVTIKAWKSTSAAPDTYTQLGTDQTDTAGDRITTAGQAGIFIYGSGGNIGLDAFYAENIGGGGPTIDTQPTDQTCYVGETATFTIAATTSGGTLSYQWKDDGANVGTNSSSYTTAAAVLGDNGAQITCAVTDDNGTTTSNAATWTVLPSAVLSWIRA